MDDLTYDGPIDLNARLLPYNLIPAAFPAWASLPGATNRVLFVLPELAGPAPRAAAEYHVISAETLAMPETVEKFLALRELDAVVGDRLFLGPPTDLKEDSPPLVLRYDPVELITNAGIDRVAVIIDIGIAFWDARFRTRNAPRFRGIRFLDFDAAGVNPLAPDTLNQNDINRLCAMATDDPDGQNQIITELGTTFPGSFYNRRAGGWRAAQWHGTAMADLMAGLPPDAPNTTALFGIELPMAALRDADGDSLATILPLAIESALAMTQGLNTLPLTIVLPWGFSAGPQDGSHPVAVAIQSVLATQSWRQINLVVPAGNQLQDRCCAHLTPNASMAPEDDAVWHVPADDFSQNAVEFCVVAPASVARQTVRIMPPYGPPAVVALKAFQAMIIRRAGKIIGILLRFADTSAGPRLRLVLAPTGWRDGATAVTPAGNWTLSCAPADHAALWVLRDDRDRLLDGPLPRRASYFMDPAYVLRDRIGNIPLGDDPGAVVVRSGTVSALTTAAGVVPVQANERLPDQAPRQAFYSGRNADGAAIPAQVMVDDGRPGSGVMAAADGTAVKMRVSGTSAAAALHARAILGL